jgi:vacuolar-type H+-ATPase subunit H
MEAQQARKEAEEILSRAEADAKQIREQATGESREIKAQSKHEAAGLREEAILKLMEAEDEAAEIIARAEQEAKVIVLKAQKGAKDLWSWAEVKAKDAGITPEEWKQVIKAREEILNKAQEVLESARQEAAEIIGRARAGEINQEELEHLGQVHQAGREVFPIASHVQVAEESSEIAAYEKITQAPNNENPGKEAETVDTFLSASCVVGPEISTMASDLYEVYSFWEEGEGNIPLSQNRFGAILRERGFERVRTKHGIIWKGIGIA